MFEIGYDSATDSGVITAPGRNLELNTGWGELLTLRAGSAGMHFNIQTDAGSDATAMTLNSAGRLGILTDTPEAQLHVEAAAGVTGVYSRSMTGKAVDALTTAWSSNEWIPAIYGRNEGAGDGVYGWSQSRNGTVGVTSSANPDHAGVYGTNNGVGPAIHADGDLVVSGAVRGDIGPNNGAPISRPAYDSGWTEVDDGVGYSFGHFIGGNVDNYVVDVQCKDTRGGAVDLGIQGNDHHGGTGAHWWRLTTESIGVSVQAGEDSCGQVRVRIWVYN
jgi:hypothetical protein